MEFNKNEYLSNVLESYRMSHVQEQMDKFIDKRNQVTEALAKKYADKKASNAINSGSYAKHDAVNVKFDIDVCQPFKYGSFKTLEEMADDVFNFFATEYEDDELIKYETRKQRVSTGLTFLIDGDKIKMDIVPGRELSEGDYEKSKDLNLHVRAKLDKPATSTQTNIQTHIDHIKGKDGERQIIRLLKTWKFNKNKDIKSFFMELITIRAFEDKGKEVPSDLWGKLKMTMEYMRDKVESIRLVDPANSNNIVSDTMDEAEKKNLSEDMKRMLDRIEEDGENLKIYFPENDKYAKKDEKDNSGPAILKTKSFS